MKEILHKRRRDLGRGTKLITINSRIEDKESRTRVRKSFLYHVTRSEEAKVAVNAPEIFIRKSFDTLNKIEKFCFQIKGSFFTTNGEVVARVYFHHCLNVQVSWKDFNLPQKVSGTDPA
ncbi:MAG TPA: hypothetical protein DE315_08915 [Candidatus Omnitrophica bacterium]|nr:hypothetical protein [Candidatus Omnitrophota bacterium]HCI45629.1 hypothetical protein [Candidatus Omnitrophota bacterium]